MGDDAYGKRQRRKKSSGQGCVILLAVSAGIIAALTEGARWLV